MNMENYPLVSFCVIAYKAEDYICEAVQAAFNQDYPNIEIILSDDGSPDNTYSIMKEMVTSYKGPHKIVLNQNKTNIGPREHYCKVLYDLTQGEILIIADGDDISLPNRTSVTVDIMQRNPEISSLSFNSELIDERGEYISSQRKELKSDRYYSIFTLSDYTRFDFFVFSDDSRAFRRKVIDSFPKLKYPFAEDIYLFLRCLYVGPIAYVRQPLVKYRQHNNSIMGKSRLKKRVSKVEKNAFKNKSEKQIWEDFYYSIENGYIDKEDEIEMTQKLHKLIKWLRPKHMYMIHRAVRKFLRIISKKSYEMAYSI